MGAAQEAAQATGGHLMIAVSPALRRSLAAFLRPHLPDALVLSLTDLPETRRVEVSRSIGMPQQSLPQPGGQGA